MVWKSSKTASYQCASLLRSTLRMYHSRDRAFAASGSSLISYTVVFDDPAHCVLVGWVARRAAGSFGRAALCGRA